MVNGLLLIGCHFHVCEVWSDYMYNAKHIILVHLKLVKGLTLELLAKVVKFLQMAYDILQSSSWLGAA